MNFFRFIILERQLRRMNHYNYNISLKKRAKKKKTEFSEIITLSQRF